YFTDSGFPQEAAENLATQLFSVLDSERLELDDLNHLQDAMTAAWIAADPERAAAALEALRAEAQQSVSNESWSRTLRASLNRVVGSVHQSHGWRAAIDHIAQSAASQAIVESTAVAGLLEETALGLPDGVNAPWLQPPAEPALSLSHQDAARLLVRHRFRVGSVLQRLRRFDHVSISMLKDAFVSTGLSKAEGELLAKALMTRGYAGEEGSILPLSLRADSFDDLIDGD
ncbi:MAG: hypothetical protein AAFQ82_26185, partial [Myxococcota bacterium]